MSISHRGIIPVMGARMSATGRLVCVARGVGKTGAGSATTGAVALAVLLAAGAAARLPEVGGGGVAATAGAVAPEAGVAAGLAVTGRWEVPGAVGVATSADEAARLAAAVLGGVAVTAAVAWPPAAAWPPAGAVG